MMTELLRERFTLKNLDCAACAMKLEKGLSHVPGVDEAVVDFANQTLHVRATDMAAVASAVQRIDPQLQLIRGTDAMQPLQAKEAAISQKRLIIDYILLGAATVLFVVQIVFESQLHANGFWMFELLLTLTAYVLVGWNVFGNAFRTIRKGDFFDENVLMVIATVGALAIHAYAEAIGVMLFYKIGELLQDRAIDRSRRSIRSLLQIKPERAWLNTLSGYQAVTPEAVQVGDTILVKPGERVPLDGQVLTGASRLDSAALTGESYPQIVREGDGVLAGQVNLSSALTIRVLRPYAASSIAKIMDLVENATARKAKTEKFITTFARYYTPAVVAMAAAIAFIPPLMIDGASFETWIYRALVLLVISCPCALVVSIPLGYFGGIGKASRRGILIKGSNFIDALSAAGTVVFDKTGTLTRGRFEVREVISLNGFSNQQLLEFAAAAEYHSNHPIALSVQEAFHTQGGDLDLTRIDAHTDMPGQGVKARYRDHEVMVGNDHLLHTHKVAHSQCDFDTTVAHIVVDGRYAGYITIGDAIRDDAAATIQALRDNGIQHISMLTGDNDCTAAAVAQRLKLDSYHANLLPEKKVARLEAIAAARPRDKTVYLGDGINDAPVIARADVGVAMGAMGSDAAIETADVVLMHDSPAKLAEAVSIARQTRAIVWQNIALAFGIKGAFIALGAMGLASMWAAVFADVGTALLAVVNATRMLKSKGRGKRGASGRASGSDQANMLKLGCID